MTKYLFVAIVFSLTACSSNNMSISKDYSLNSSKGVVFFSVRHDPISECEKPAPFFVYIHKPQESAILGKTVNIKNFLIETDFKNPDGYFYTLELDKGKHYITHSALHYKSRGVDKRIRLEFNVTPNKATYIGEISFKREHKAQSNQDCSIVRVNRTSKYNRDLEFLIERAVNITPNNVINELAKATYLN